MTPTEKTSPKLSHFSPAVAVYSLALLLEKPAKPWDGLGRVVATWKNIRKTLRIMGSQN